MSERQFPDLSDILARKEAGRRERAQLSISEKLAVLDRLRETAERMKQARLSRSQQSQAAAGSSKD